MQNCKYGADLLEWTWCKDQSGLHLAPFYGLPQLMGNFRCYTSQINLHTGTHFWVNFLEILETEVWLPFPFIPRHFWSWRGTKYPWGTRYPGYLPRKSSPRPRLQSQTSRRSRPSSFWHQVRFRASRHSGLKRKKILVTDQNYIVVDTQNFKS